MSESTPASGTPGLAEALQAVQAMRQAAARLGASAVEERTRASADGTVQVTVGGLRLRAAVLDPSVLRIGQSVDRVRLQEQILHAWRTAAGLPETPQPVRPQDAPALPSVAGAPAIDPQAVAAFAVRRFDGNDPDGAVTVTLDGAGAPVGLTISELATRGEALTALGDRVVAADGAAAAVHATERAAAFGLDRIESTLAEQIAAYDERMEQVAGRLSDLTGAVRGRIAEVQELYAKRIK